jgi:hypothetical protein
VASGDWAVQRIHECIVGCSCRCCATRNLGLRAVRLMARARPIEGKRFLRQAIEGKHRLGPASKRNPGQSTHPGVATKYSLSLKASSVRAAGVSRGVSPPGRAYLEPIIRSAFEHVEFIPLVPSELFAACHRIQDRNRLRLNFAQRGSGRPGLCWNVFRVRRHNTYRRTLQACFYGRKQSRTECNIHAH